MKGINELDLSKDRAVCPSSDERLQGYIQGLAKNNIKVDKNLIVETDLTKSQNESAIKKLLTLKEVPSAVITFNDYVALDAMKFTKNEGYKINRDIYFASYANLPVTNYLDDPPIASVEQFPHQQAEKATKILFDLIESKDSVQPVDNKIILEGKLVLHQKRKDH
jgi:Transcriptional regulators